MRLVPYMKELLMFFFLRRFFSFLSFSFSLNKFSFFLSKVEIFSFKSEYFEVKLSFSIAHFAFSFSSSNKRTLLFPSASLRFFSISVILFLSRSRSFSKLEFNSAIFFSLSFLICSFCSFKREFSLSKSLILLASPTLSVFLFLVLLMASRSCLSSFSFSLFPLKSSLTTFSFWSWMSLICFW